MTRTAEPTRDGTLTIVPWDGARSPTPELLEDLAARYRSAVQADEPDRLATLYLADALLDFHVPNWRFQVMGADAVARQACVLPRPGRFASVEVEPTARGALVRFEWRQATPDGEAAVRQLHAWELAEGRIAEHVVFCAGVWDPRHRARMAVEAPLHRP